MASPGLNLGQIAYLEDYTSSRAIEQTPRERPSATSAGDGPAPQAVRPMFELQAGNLQRPFRGRSSLGSTLVSSIAHGAFFAAVFVIVSMSGQLNLPDVNQTSNLVAILVAAPPPPPPAAAVPASPAPAASAATPDRPVQRKLAPPPQQLALNLDLPLAPPEERPAIVLAAAPALGNGVDALFGSGSGAGAGFGAEGGVGWGTSASGPGAPVRVGKEISAPEVLHRVEPVYPKDAVAARVEGVVVVEATVDEQGNVIAVKVLRSIGSLDQAAIDAVSQWRYSPLRVNNQPSQFVLTVNVTFRLH